MKLSKTCGSVLLLLLSSGALAHADATSAGSQAGPSRGKPAKSTEVCFSLDEAAAIDVTLAEQARDLKILRAKVRKFGWVVGCGVGIVGEIQDGQTTLDSSPTCALIYGLRF